MKSFILSLLLFSTIIGGIIANSFYVTAFCNDLTYLCELAMLEQPNEDTVLKIKSLWEKKRPILDISIKTNELEKMNDLIQSLISVHKSKNSAEFDKYCILITELAKEFSEHERISFRSIC